MEQTAARIDGQAITTPEGMHITAPYDGQVIGEVPLCTEEHVNRAVAAANRTFEKERLPGWYRAQILDRAAETLADPEIAERFSRSIALESAKPIRTARVEVQRAVSTFRFAAAVCRTLSGEVLPLDASRAGASRLGFTMRVPIGVVGAITPFNFPLNLVVHKLAPAIAVGCPIVLKPAHQTPLTGMMIAELLLDLCGLPAGWLHVVTGEGASVGNALVVHDDVSMITFTGSPPVGWGIRARAPRKKVSLELGNNTPVIIEPDSDWKGAAAKIAGAGFSHAGQSCISVQRVIVHEQVAQAFTKELTDAVGRLTVGDPLEETTEVSALIDRNSRDRVQSWIEEAVREGAAVLEGGFIDTGGVLRPTVLADVRPEMKVWSHEVFGPVIALAAYSDVDEAFAIANDTAYGLHAGIFTSRLDVARRAIETLDFGGVVVNDVPTWRADQMPYGGLRDSGNTREGPQYSALEMTEIRTAILA